MENRPKTRLDIVIQAAFSPGTRSGGLEVGGRGLERDRTFGRSLCAVRLHGNVRVEMIQCPICFFTSLPSTLVHAFDFLVTTTWSLVLLRTGYGHKRIDLGKRVRILFGNTKSEE